jgi:hypothetical protein
MSRRQLSVTVDHSGSVSWTSVLGQSRTVTPYDYRLEPPADAAGESVTEAAAGSAPVPEPPPF